MSHADAAEAATFLESLLGKTLQVTIIDGRLFTGTFRCTDNETNIILSNSFEYRMPSVSAKHEAYEKATMTGKSVAKANMTSRFVGLIVIPSEQIVRMEVEERRMPSSGFGSGSGSSLAIRGKG